MTDRFCARGCGRSLAGRRKNTIYCGAVECRDNARRAEEAACSTTTTVTTFPSAVANGNGSRRKRSGSWVSPCPPPVGTARSCSSVSAKPTPLRPSPLHLPPVSEASEAVLHDWRDLDDRRAARERRGRNDRVFRCPACKAFKPGPRVTCACGYDPGYGYAA